MDDLEAQMIVDGVGVAPWDRIESVWSSVDRVYCSPPRGPSPVALRLAKHIAANRPDVRDLLIKHLDHPNPIVVGYIVFTLLETDDTLLPLLRERVANRTEKIKYSHGCFVDGGTLHDFVRSFDPEECDI